MTPEDIAATITSYGAGLDAEMGLLRQLQQLSVQQRDVTAQNDYDLIQRCTDERERLLATLFAIEEQIRPLRQTLADLGARAAQYQGFSEVAALHRVASALVNEIVETDRATLEALRTADVARRALTQSLQVGENTLSAYRRVVAPPASNAALVDERG